MNLRYYIFRNMGWKIGSLMMAILIWFAIKDFSTRAEMQFSRLMKGPTEERTFFRLPVQVLKPGQDDRLYVLEPDRINLTLRGEPFRMRSTQEDQILIFVKVPDELDGLGVVRELEIHRPDGIEVVAVEPESIKIRLKQNNVKANPSNSIQTNEQF